MKKHFLSTLLAIFVISSPIYAQQSFSEAIDSLFRFVSRVDATTGVLYERVLPFSGFQNFRGNAPDTADYDKFTQVYDIFFSLISKLL